MRFVSLPVLLVALLYAGCALTPQAAEMAHPERAKHETLSPNDWVF